MKKLFILVFALARPVTLEKTVTPPVEGKDILVKGTNSVHLNKTIDSL